MLKSKFYETFSKVELLPDGTTHIREVQLVPLTISSLRFYSQDATKMIPGVSREELLDAMSSERAKAVLENMTIEPLSNRIRCTFAIAQDKDLADLEKCKRMSMKYQDIISVGELMIERQQTYLDIYENETLWAMIKRAWVRRWTK